MRHHEGTFTTIDGLHLYYQSWHPPDRSRGIVSIIHGLGGHCGTFQRVVQYLVSQRYGVYGFDMRGHGRSPGQRAYLNHWSDYREDLHHFLQLIRSQESAPCFLLGHSLGGLTVLEYCLRFPTQIQGVVALAPALKQVGVSPLRLMLGKILSQIYPRFSLNTGISLETASRDQQVIAAYRNDPLRHSLGTARLATEFQVTTAWVWQHAAELQVPLLLMHGKADQVTSWTASYKFFQQIPLADKQWYEYTDTYHHLYDDLNASDILVDLAKWLAQHLEQYSQHFLEKQREPGLDILLG